MGNALCIAFVNMEPDAKEIQICSSLCNDNKFDFELINNSKITRALDQSHNHDLREKFLGIRSDYHIHISTIMTRKKDLYIPLIEDVIKLIEKCKRSDLFSKLNDTFIQEVIQKQYKYRLDEQILVFLKEIDNKIKLFNQIDAIYVAKNLILNLFHKGFKELYGDIIDGEIPIYFEGELVDYEDVYPEEYDNIRRISSNDDLVKKAICGEYEYVEFNGELYNPTLVKMFEFALAERNKFHSVQRVPIVAWKGPPEFYIASIGNFYSMYSDDEDIKNKKNILKEIISRAENMENTLDQILKEIFEKFEKI
ncbi:hypothetical protein [Paenibacillus polymyxa]|nr:hypothetical protein [Paenibacillus polymyxa]POR27185.1 hypothetical protein CG775_15020 [Paenibacillus polymyxa]